MVRAAAARVPTPNVIRDLIHESSPPPVPVMLMAGLALIVGLAVLIWSAERFVDGAVATAHHFRLPGLIIGTVIVGIGTSAPEFVVSGLAAWSGQPGLAIGNAYGSNIANIGLILGLTLLLSPMIVASGVVRRELALLAAVTLGSLLLLLDGTIGRLDAALLLVPLIGYLGLCVRQARRPTESTSGPAAASVETEPPTLGLRGAVAWLIVGLILLVASSRLLVWGAVTIATTLGVSDLVIGLTVVAVGTSLPELASSISALRRNAHDLVLGNVLGSNLFNTLGVVGVAGLIAPIDIEPLVVQRDWPVMMAMTVLLLLFAMRWRAPRARLSRLEGGVLLAIFVGYTTWLVLGALAAPTG